MSAPPPSQLPPIIVVSSDEDAAAGERQPLLAVPPPYPSPDALPDSERGTPEDTPDEAVETAPVKPRSPWVSAGYVVLTLGVIVGIAFVFKAIFDAYNVKFDLGKTLKSALGGGLSGAAAMVLQVLTLMPLRTIMNYQYRFGTGTRTAARTLYRDGGFGRYYQGLAAALVQGPTARFGDTAANAGILALLEAGPLRTLHPLAKTVFASLAAAAFRMLLTPIDTLKTTLQAQGRPGLRILRARILEHGVGSLFWGAFATAAATFAGHYPWFGTYNYLDDVIPLPETVVQKLARQALIGFCASVVSDTVSNSLRVLKTYRQVNATRIGYADAARAVIAADGVKGLFGRGLKTRILTNGLQGLMFSILWKLFMDLWNDHTK